MAPPSTVILIDDDPWLCEAVAAQLEARGHAVVVADTRDGVRTALLGEPAAFVLLDVRIPGLRTEDVLDEIAAAWPSVPVLLHSGYEREALPDALFRRGRVGFVAKPLDERALDRELARLVG